MRASANYGAWDTAARQAVVEAAGGAVITQEGTRLHYGGLGGLKNRGFVAGCSQYLAQTFASSASRTLALFRGSMN
jgi:3'(2'), 5'-bisphosphate nucleotidase